MNSSDHFFILQSTKEITIMQKIIQPIPVFITIALFCFYACTSKNPSKLSTTIQRPNVILVITDDQGYGDLACHGNPFIQTPHLDDFYKESVRLTDFHVSPTCAPTRAALMTGRYTNRTGVWHTIAGWSLLRENEKTLGNMFAEEIPGIDADIPAGQSLVFEKARVQLGDTILASSSVDNDKEYVNFTIHLPKGKNKLSTMFTSNDGQELGAYYVSVELEIN